MTTIFVSVAVLGGLGVVFGLVLAFSAQVFAVEEDPRLGPLTEALPGANCGGCGFSGCAAYAQAVIDGTTVLGGCPVGGQEAAEAMAKVMGVAYTTKAVRQVAQVRCTGKGQGFTRYDYSGLPDCQAAVQVTGGGALACPYGCLGLGACAKVCRFGAIRVVNGVARVDEEKCAGCLQCVAACPRSIITVVPYDAGVSILCASHYKGVQTRTVCGGGCIGCSLCVKACPTGAVRVEDNLAYIDYALCTACGQCAEVCPQKLIDYNGWRKNRIAEPPAYEQGVDVGKAVSAAGENETAETDAKAEPAAEKPKRKEKK